MKLTPTYTLTVELTPARAALLYYLVVDGMDWGDDFGFWSDFASLLHPLLKETNATLGRSKGEYPFEKVYKVNK